MHEDRFGLKLTTESAEAAALYRQGIDCVLSAWTGAAQAFDGAIEADDGFALAWLGRARVHHMNAESALAREKLAIARQRANHASGREQAHVAVIAAAIEGHSREAITGALAHLRDYPRDAFVMATLLGAFGLFAFSGRADHDRARVDLCEANAHHYGEDWWFLTHRGWALTEAGETKRGRAFTEKALTLRWRNGNAAHALAHAFFETGEVAEGVRFIEEWLPIYEPAAILNSHITWHLALHAIEQGDIAWAKRLYESRLHPGQSLAPPLNLFTDAASLLWRIDLESEIKDDLPWADVADFGEKAFPKAGMHFADVHAAMALAGAGRFEALAERIAALTELEAEGRLAPGRVVIDLCLAFQDFRLGRYAEAAERLHLRQADIVRIGGSHAQRELVEDTYIVAALRAGNRPDIRDVLRARLARRPSERDRRWLAKAGG